MKDTEEDKGNEKSLQKKERVTRNDHIQNEDCYSNASSAHMSTKRFANVLMYKCTCN